MSGHSVRYGGGVHRGRTLSPTLSDAIVDSVAVPSVTRKPANTREARRNELVAQMLEVIERLIAEGETYTELSVERLIQSANISRSTFYVYFEDKGTLLLALAQDVMQQIIGVAGAWWNLPPDASREDVEGALRGIIDVYFQHAAVWAALVDASAYDPNVRESYRQVVGQSIDALAKHIRDGQKAGTVRAGLDPKRTAAWLTWMTERGLYQELVGASRAEITKLSRALTDIVWYTLYADAPNRPRPKPR
jgi:AcrR family transcriptional regulator